MTQKLKIFVSEKVYLDGACKPACILVKNGKIVTISDKNDLQQMLKEVDAEVLDVGTDVIIPGIVDAHVHVNEPGRTEWEGYYTATRAAAAGGVTTIVDMPLNSIPSTTSLKAFRTKLDSAANKCFVDVGFWGGIVPGNEAELLPMLQAGVPGFKCFLIHSGVDDFPAVTRADLETAFTVLQGSDAVVLFHAEVDCNCGSGNSTLKEPRLYETFLETRPEVMEVEAIKMVCDLCLNYRVRCHIVHLSAATALPLIQAARSAGAPLTVETTHHYLTLEAETIPEGATQFKCCPPIRSKNNQTALWSGLRDGHIDMVVSDHSPCTPDLKHLDTGDFLTAWGGISSLQFGLSLFWTHAQERGFQLSDLVRVLCENTAKLARMDDRKGRIAVGYDADFVVWKPNDTFHIEQEKIQHKNKVTPYMGKQLKGVVHMTILRGNIIHGHGLFSDDPQGDFLLVGGGQQKPKTTNGHTDPFVWSPKM